MKNSALFVTEIKSYYKDKILKFLKPQVEEFSITTFIFKFKKNNFFRFFFIIIKIQTHIVHVNKQALSVLKLMSYSKIRCSDCSNPRFEQWLYEYNKLYTYIMFVSIIFCKESINGEVIFMFMTKMWLFIPSSIFKLESFEISYNFILLVILQIFDVEDNIYSYCTLSMGLAIMQV